MTNKSECVLCNPDIGGNTVCDECLDKAASYDDVRLRLTLAGLAFRRIAKYTEFSDVGSDSRLAHHEAQNMVATNCKPELDRYDAMNKKLRQEAA